MKYFKINNYLNLIIISIIIFIDLISKFFIFQKFNLYESYYINSYLNLYYIKNYGIIFGIFGESNKYNLIILFFNILILIILYYKNIKQKSIIFMYNLVIAGLLGNLINRIINGFVIDFIDVHIGNFHYPIFNLADISIVIGVIFLIIY
ncbi:signal peptidase II [Enterobacteriaceae endosymbiont of Plateumaris consimilis]|uniref:signal peptidase II n=1 Tax=Enterobacteriaceae endosymbiont of Plateumaris consimilis TaxID=2675794 RepID=UPI001449B88D|nr:signal peptidase II [Enterobacteriaceae endosymbiont of Plateumaris consimilis]QJC28480.1 signal peptidase II [Enterobacteriaceae endosymbiont of Plateumaris consimilis]